MIVIFQSCKEQSLQEKIESVLKVKFESQHFIYYTSEKDSVDTLNQERYFSWICKELLFKTQEKIKFYKFKDKIQMQTIIGNDSIEYYDTKANYICNNLSYDNYYITHFLLIKYLGKMPPLFSVGISLSKKINWETNILGKSNYLRDYDLESQNLIKNNKLPDILKILDSKDLREFDQNIGYNYAASFTHYLLKNYGIQNFKDFIIIYNNNKENYEIHFTFNHNFPVTMVEAWLQWKSYVSNYFPNEYTNDSQIY